MPPTTTSATYTTIPNADETIPRSVMASQLPPLRWQEFFSRFGSPTSLSDAWTRYRMNTRHFSINYCLTVAVCVAASVMGWFITLLMFALVLHLWLNLHLFSEGSLVVWGRNISSRIVVLALGLLAVALVWIFRFPPFNSSMWETGLEVGIVLSIVHAVFRNPDGDYLDEDGAISSGLIVSAVASPSVNSVRSPL